MPPIYHFSDVDNLETDPRGWALRAIDRRRRANIGNVSIKGNSELIEVGWGRAGRCADDVVLLRPEISDAVQHHARQRAGRRSNQRRLLYFVSSTEAMYDAGLRCVFSDGNAGTFGVTKFEDDPEKLASHVDWPVMNLTMWNNTDADPDRIGVTWPNSSYMKRSRSS